MKSLALALSFSLLGSMASASNVDAEAKAKDLAVEHFIQSGEFERGPICSDSASTGDCLHSRAIFGDLNQHYLVIFENEFFNCTYSILVSKDPLQIDFTGSSHDWLCTDFNARD